MQALLLANRVRVLARASVLLTVTSAGAAWADGSKFSTPALAVVLAHLSVQASVILPVQWQFAGDPARRQARAVRAMTVAFVLLSIIALIDAASALHTAPTPIRARVDVGLGLIGIGTLTLPRIRKPPSEGLAFLGWPTPLAAVLAVMVSGAVQLAVIPGVALASLWCVVAGAAARQARVAWRADETACTRPTRRSVS